MTMKIELKKIQNDQIIFFLLKNNVANIGRKM